jgi:hypothetical protein
MTCESENPEPSLFDKDEPRVVLTPAQKIELETLVKTLLFEIATALLNGEAGDDQDHI